MVNEEDSEILAVSTDIIDIKTPKPRPFKALTSVTSPKANPSRQVANGIINDAITRFI
jgi:hypothetical protein